MKFLFKLLTVFTCLVLTQTSWGEGSTITTSVPSRSFGFYLSAGNPFPALLGINGAYNLTENFRLIAGYGAFESNPTYSWNGREIIEENCKMKTSAAGAEIIFINADIKGAFGLKFAYLDISGRGDPGISDVKESTSYMYSNLGIDWTNQHGFHVATGLNVAYAGLHSAGVYVNSGYFF